MIAKRLVYFVMAATLPLALITAVFTVTDGPRPADASGGDSLRPYIDADAWHSGLRLTTKLVWSTTASYDNIAHVDTGVVLAGEAGVVVLANGAPDSQLEAVKALSTTPSIHLSSGYERDEVWVVTGRRVVERYSTSADTGPLSVVIVNDNHMTGADAVPGRLIVRGIYPDSLLHMYSLATSPEQTEPGAPVNVEGVLTATAGRPVMPGLHRTLARQLHVGETTLSPDRQRIAVAFWWHDRIDVYDTEELALVRSIAGPRVTQLNVGVAEVGERRAMTVIGDTSYTYIDVTATDKWIFALYSGAGFRDGPAAFGLGHFVHAFSWDGNFAGEWQLDRGLNALSVHPDGAELLGLRWDTALTEVVVVDGLELAERLPALETGRRQ